MKTLIEGLEILCKYDPHAEIAADHDLIIVAVDPESMTDEDCQALDGLPGWHERKDKEWGYFT